MEIKGTAVNGIKELVQAKFGWRFQEVKITQSLTKGNPVTEFIMGWK